MNQGQVRKIHEIVEFKKIYTLIAKNPRNFGAH